MNIQEIDSAAQQAERSRISEINAIGTLAKKHLGDKAADELTATAIRSGWEVNDFRKVIYNTVPSQAPTRQGTPTIGMNEREVQHYSFAKAVMEAADGRLSGLELEASDAARRQSQGLPLRGTFTIPNDVLSRGWMQRDSLVATNTLGGFLVGTQLQASSFIDALRARVVAMRLGARTITGLVGNVVIPRLNTSATINWVGEVVASTESNIHLGQVTLTPKCPSVFVDYSKLCLTQATPDLENLLRSDLASQIACAIDRSVFHSLGGTAPVGLETATGVNVVTIGDNGGALTWSKILEMEEKISTANADISTMALATNPKVRSKLKQTLKNATATDATFIWDTETPGAPVNGYPVAISTNISSSLTAGTSTTVCSAMYAGYWDQVLIGFWGGLDILVDRVSSAANRIIRVYADQYVDINFRNGACFSRCLDALTT